MHRYARDARVVVLQEGLARGLTRLRVARVSTGVSGINEPSVDTATGKDVIRSIYAWINPSRYHDLLAVQGDAYPVFRSPPRTHSFQ